MTLNKKAKLMAKLEDQELINGYLTGSEACLEVLIARHKTKLMGTILMIVKDKDLAQDLYQEALIKITQVFNSGSYNDEGKYLPWACRIAKNIAIDNFRKEKRSPFVTSSTSSTNLMVYENVYKADETIEVKWVQSDTIDTVKELIEKLPEEQKEVVMLRNYEELSFKEIAEMKNISINTALGRMRYALGNLRKMMAVNAQTADYA